MPIYEHKCEDCNYEWEDLYKLSDPVPEECPECHIKGKVKRLISWASGVVELTGRDLVKKLKTDAKKEASKMTENQKANFVGEDKYQAVVQRQDRISKDYGKI